MTETHDNTVNDSFFKLYHDFLLFQRKLILYLQGHFDDNLFESILTKDIEIQYQVLDIISINSNIC